MNLKSSGAAAAAQARAYARDLASGFVRQIDRKTNRVVAGGAAFALVLGVGVGMVGRAPLDRALTPHPMEPLPGTAELPASLPPAAVAAAPTSSAPAPPSARVAMSGDPPVIVAGEQPQPAEESPADTATPDDDQTIQAPRPRPDWSPDRYGPPEGPPPWAYARPRVWSPPPPDEGPD